jgi:hypothetical protein
MNNESIELETTNTVEIEEIPTTIPHISANINTFLQHQNESQRRNIRNQLLLQTPSSVDVLRESMNRRAFNRFYYRERYVDQRNIARSIDSTLFYERNYTIHNCGSLNHVCIYCKAIFFDIERLTNGAYKRCCEEGTIVLPKFHQPSPTIQDLFDGESEMSKLFLKSPRFYNTQLSFASISMELSHLPTRKTHV